MEWHCSELVNVTFGQVRGGSYLDSEEITEDGKRYFEELILDASKQGVGLRFLYG